MYLPNPVAVDYHHKARMAYLAEEYAAAQVDAKFVTEKANQLVQWAREQVRNLSSGMNQGSSGTLQPSA